MTIAMIENNIERFPSIEEAKLDSLIEKAQGKRIVLLGESTHGTAEFYQMRAYIGTQLIKKGFKLIALEADWPDAVLVDRYICGESQNSEEKAFERFPLWMWKNREFFTWIQWLREYNKSKQKKDQVRIFGMDIYSLYRSIDAVLRHFSKLNPELASKALEHYGCLNPWKDNPSEYGLSAALSSYGDCEEEVLSVLNALLQERLDHQLTEEEYFDTVQNARIVAGAEEYYRTMYSSTVKSWNLRDSHMFETLEMLLDFYGESSQVMVWAHNSHVGDAYATDMGRLRGEFNIGSLCKHNYGGNCLSIGFGTFEGTVAAADEWNGPIKVKTVRPAFEDSYEYLFHQVDAEKFYLDLQGEVKAGLQEEMFERAIGVVYRPETERVSHYFSASLTEQFDGYIWFDKTHAVTPLEKVHLPEEGDDTYPFGI